MSYATTLELAEFMHIDSKIPNPDIVADTRSPENVGTGDETNLKFFLDHAFILNDSYTISYGADEDNLTDLTETTHYTLDKDLGKLLLTTDGRTAVGTDDIFAAYSYVKLGLYYRDEGATYSFFKRTYPKSHFSASAIGWFIIFGYISTLALYAYPFSSYAILLIIIV